MRAKWLPWSWQAFSCSRCGGHGRIYCVSFEFVFQRPASNIPNFRSWVLIIGMSGLIVLFWFVAGGIALRYFVLFIGVMSCMYVVWDVIGQFQRLLLDNFLSTLTLEETDDTLARKVNTSDASEFARICGCCPSRGKENFTISISIPT